MKAAGSSNIKAVAGASGIALLTGALVFGLASIVVLPQTPRVHQPKTGFVLTSSTCPASSVTPPAFSVCGPAVGAGPLLVPGAPASGLPLTFYNGLKVGLSIYKLTVAFSNAFPVGCPASSLQLGGATVGGVPPTITGSQPNVTFTFATNHFFQVPGATSSAGTSIYHATLGLLDSGNQDACKNLGLSMSYTAWAQYTELYSTATTVVTSGSPSVVGTQVTFTATVTASATTGQD
ncbi:MAG TPA: hypothetical protein VKR22_01595, partial [Acidimicrobiales bacterium]|nr:hypothetical protein [Acidimicrobiales bacterium]